MGKDYTNRLGARQVYHYLLLLVILVLLGSLNRPLTTQAGEIPQPVFGNHSILLPLILKWSPGKGIYGQVTVDGAPAAGVGLLLKFFDGFSGYTYANTTTDANGTASISLRSAVVMSTVADIPGRSLVLTSANVTLTLKLVDWS